MSGFYKYIYIYIYISTTYWFLCFFLYGTTVVGKKTFLWRGLRQRGLPWRRRAFSVIAEKKTRWYDYGTWTNTRDPLKLTWNGRPAVCLSIISSFVYGSNIKAVSVIPGKRRQLFRGFLISRERPVVTMATKILTREGRAVVEGGQLRVGGGEGELAVAMTTAVAFHRGSCVPRGIPAVQPSRSSTDHASGSDPDVCAKHVHHQRGAREPNPHTRLIFFFKFISKKKIHDVERSINPWVPAVIYRLIGPRHNRRRYHHQRYHHHHHYHHRNHHQRRQGWLADPIG